MKALAILAVLAAPAAADPVAPSCDAVDDPASTPVRDGGLDGQRSACLRRELAAGVTAHALVDTPGFRGVLGGDLAVAGRGTLGALELGARARLVDYSFVQNAVNKVTATRFGPIVVGAAYATAIDHSALIAVVVAAELPFTRDDMATTRTGGETSVVFTGALASCWTLHARLGAIAAAASSAGGSSSELALRAGFDLAWRARARLGLAGGAEAQAGWYPGLDTILVRGGLAWRPGGGSTRLVVGLGLPLGGHERTNAILTLGVARDLDVLPSGR